MNTFMNVFMNTVPAEQYSYGEDRKGVSHQRANSRGPPVFFIGDNSLDEASLQEKHSPVSRVGIPEVTSAHFAGSVLLLVVNRKVYVYDYEANSWNASTGVEHPVSHVSGDNCCYSGNSFCMDISNSVFAYLHGDQISQANIYFSNTRGYRFQKYAQERQAMFGYSDHPLNHSFGLPFDYNGTLDVLIAPGQKGILIFWFEKSLLVSRNAGQLVNPVQVREGQHILYSSISEANITIHSVAANENELAVLTRENHLYYGSLGILSSSLIKFADQNIWSEEAVLMFTDVGMLEILTPLPDSIFPAFDFQKCPVNIQAILMDPQLQVDVCKVCGRDSVELLQGEFENKMYTIDMNSELELTALMIPRPSTSPVPLVRTLYLLNKFAFSLLLLQNISLRQQQHWGRADPNFTSSFSPSFVARSEISACYNGVLDPVALQDNYSYVIER
ncbi:hypothetical protein E2I00_004804 [Balaenoptera physalus]|uniref:Cation channel sperm-associated protein subunit delta n=1 Tax=Balaenoptera physalus TaxID=9770 RepID=A0A6A1Q3U0_BALPH|nr:hypothetical protein E2I00_004804 [Balaenoptera physalus]